ncbi:multicopper oxidase domain-containing protein [Singulisphaera sp. Ch08]|uniref:Multicopper oxidase domain-containing protein n=1 Tax=Singulisphaera sp. Ch08 TaxID=3120278 RepID=A0AAU7CLD6_9BACT
MKSFRSLLGPIGRRPRGNSSCCRPVLEPVEDRLAPAVLVEPPVISSQNGTLQTTLEELETPALIEGQAVTGTMTYNGSFAGVTLKAHPGDLLDLKLVNRLSEQTNLHTHGLHVSPVGNGDNPLLQIAPGESNDYRIQIPADHPQGMYWYHPHEHGLVDDQIRAGLSGMLVIGRADGGAPELDGYEQALLGIKTISSSGGAPLFSGLDTPAYYSVNGQIKPTMTMAPGEIQVWNVANLSFESYFRLQLDGHQLHVVAQDGNPLTRVQTVDFIDLVPGSRVSFLVQARTTPGSYGFRTLGYFNGFNSAFAETLTTLEVKGTPVAASLPTTLTPPANYYEDLGAAIPAAERSILFQEDKANLVYSVNGQTFPNVPAITARLNTVEEWTLLNDTSELHPFHIHQNGFQLMSVNGRAVPADGTPMLINATAQYTEGFTPASEADTPPQSEQFIGGSLLDTVNIPAKDPVTGEPGRVVIRLRFTDYVGTVVYHCHILFHEDHGMMGLIRLAPEVPTYAVAANAGSLPRVNVIDPITGQVVGDFLAYEPSYRGGVNVAMADVNGDGVNDVITGRARGLPQVKVIDGRKLGWVKAASRVILPDALLGDFLAFGPHAKHGVSVAAGYLDGDDKADIVVGEGDGGRPGIRVVDATKLDQVGRNRLIQPSALLHDFLAFGAGTRSGVRVATGDINGDGRYDLIAGAGPGAAPWVKVFSGADSSLLASVLVDDSSHRGGVFVAAGNVKGFGYTDVITGAGPGSQPLVKLFSYESETMSHGSHAAATTTHTATKSGLTQVDAFLAYGRRFRGGVRVASLAGTRPLAPYGSSRDDIVTTHAVGNGLRRTLFATGSMKPGSSTHG